MGIDDRAIAARLIVSALVVGCVACMTVLTRWTYQPCSDAGYNVNLLNHVEAVVWVVAVDLLALAFVLWGNRWLTTGLGLIGLAAFAVSGPVLVLMAISECQVAGWKLVPFFTAFLGGTVLMSSSAISLIVGAVKYLASNAASNRGLSVWGISFRASDLLAGVVFAVSAVAMSLVVSQGLDWAAAVPFDLWASVIVPTATGATLALITLAAGESAIARQQRGRGKMGDL